MFNFNFHFVFLFFAKRAVLKELKNKPKVEIV